MYHFCKPKNGMKMDSCKPKNVHSKNYNNLLYSLMKLETEIIIVSPLLLCNIYIYIYSIYKFKNGESSGQPPHRGSQNYCKNNSESLYQLRASQIRGPCYKLTSTESNVCFFYVI